MSTEPAEPSALDATVDVTQATDVTAVDVTQVTDVTAATEATHVAVDDTTLAADGSMILQSFEPNDSVLVHQHDCEASDHANDTHATAGVEDMNNSSSIFDSVAGGSGSANGATDAQLTSASSPSPPPTEPTQPAQQPFDSSRASDVLADAQPAESPASHTTDPVSEPVHRVHKDRHDENHSEDDDDDGDLYDAELS